MGKTKDFDCVEMKRNVQARLAEEYAGLDEEEVRTRRAHKLATSQHPAARTWRAIAEAERPIAR
jgi:hypothetical protein